MVQILFWYLKFLNKSLPNDVRVLTKGQFIEFEKNYWKNSTAIGFIFSLGALMGFVVGCVVVYQILYSDVTDHLPEYATLLAMGYRLKTLFFVVAREGFFISIIWLFACLFFWANTLFNRPKFYKITHSNGCQ